MSSTLTLDQSVIRLHFDLLSGLDLDLLSIPLLLSAPPFRKYSNEYASRLSILTDDPILIDDRPWRGFKSFILKFRFFQLA